MNARKFIEKRSEVSDVVLFIRETKNKYKEHLGKFVSIQLIVGVSRVSSASVVVNSSPTL
jgi:hypothetical protein